MSSGTLDITITSGTDQVSVQRGGGVDPDEIRVLDGFFGAPQSCSGSPTVSNTDTVQVTDTVASHNAFVNLGLQNGPLGPGATTEGTGTSEIEFSFNAGDGTDTQRVYAGTQLDIYRFGATGVNSVSGNLNNDDDVDDVTVNQGERLLLDGGAGEDDLSANGGTGFTGPVPYSSGGMSVLHLVGGADNDQLTAGSGGWVFDSGGSAGNDTMTGGAGVDVAHVDLGNDVADGGGSADFVSYQFAPPGVHFDLGVSAQQDTVVAGLDTATNFENLVGSQSVGAPDVLIGDGGPNQINANAGDDLIIGKAGNDTIRGGLGVDTASYALGSTGPVTLSLGITGAQSTGGAGTDTLPDLAPSDGLPDVENIIGTPFGSDNLTGNTLANQIDVYDGLADTVDCVATGDGDTAIADEVGVDSLANCETTDNAPQTSIDSGPGNGATISIATPTYGLSADEPSDFEVSIDAAPFEACSPACTLPALSPGTHMIAFRAIDLDENGHADLTPATRTVTVSFAPPPPPPPADTTPPETTIGAHPKSKTRKRTATFTFTSNEPGATFLCSYDGKPFAPCSSPFTTPKLKLGKHRFDVLSTDSAGNRDQSAATFRWRIVRRKRH